MGIGIYVEGTGVGPYEGAHVQVLVSGKVVAATGIPNQGQAHATVWAQVVADELGVDVKDVEITSGDTRRFPWGVGTFASRGAVTAGNAMHVAARMVAGKAKAIAADHLEANPDDLELAGGRVFVKGSPDRGMLLGAVAVLSNPVRYALGGAFYERLVYDSDGQLRNASFMEFLMPYATEIPPIEIDHIETPSPLNPLGVKGAGEAGVIPVGAVLASAIEDAMQVPITEMPLSPLKLFELSR